MASFEEPSDSSPSTALPATDRRIRRLYQGKALEKDPRLDRPAAKCHSRCLELETTVGAAEAEFGISCLVFRTVLSQAWNSHCRTNRSWQMGIEATRLLMEATVPEPNIAILRSRFFQFEKRYSAMADMLIVCRLSDANKISPLDYVSWMAAEERQEAYFAIRWDVLLDLKREPSASKPPAPPPSGP